MSQRWWVAPQTQRMLESHGPLDVASWMQRAQTGERLSSDRSSEAVRWRGGDLDLLIKWRRPRAGRRLRTLGRASRERREARALRLLHEAGIPTPLPLAVGEQRGHGVLQGAVLLRPFLSEARVGVEVLREQPARLESVAVVWRAWHELGLRHGDAYPKNLLLDAQERWLPIGCPKAVQVTPAGAMDRRRLRDLAQWCAGLEELGLPVDSFLEHYAGASGQARLQGLAARVLEPLSQIRALKARRRATQAQREPAGPPLPVVLPLVQHPRAPLVLPLEDL